MARGQHQDIFRLSFCGLFGFTLIVAAIGATPAPHSPCNLSKCVSPQLEDAKKSNDVPNICRLMAPSLHCMQSTMPACGHQIGNTSTEFRRLLGEMDQLEKDYQRKCHAIYTVCSDFNKCLHPSLQTARSNSDRKALCEHAPPVLACFEKALKKCEQKAGYEDANFELMRKRFRYMRQRTSETCGTQSLVTQQSPALFIGGLLFGFLVSYWQVQGHV